MAEELQKAPDNTPIVSPTPRNAIVVNDAAVVGPTKSVRPVSGLEKLKKVTWRTTATVYWIWRIAHILLGSEFTYHVASTMLVRFNAFLSAVGFAPVHSEYLPRILQFGWLLALAGFRPFELLGLVIYIYIAPLSFLGYLAFREYSKDFEATPTVRKGLRPQRVRRPALTIVGLLLLGWFVLYGETSARGPLIAGTVLSGLLLFLLANRAFQRVRPPLLPAGSEPISVDEKIGNLFFTSAPETMAKALTAKKKSELVGNLFLYRKLRFIWRQLALLMRGQAGQNRLYILLLMDYVISLMVLGAAAVLFWATTAKFADAPSASSLATFVRVCSSYFLPNISASSIAPELPAWVQMGVSITAFILFVLFVGAAASLLPARFTAYAERLNKRYQVARKFVVQFKTVTRTLEKLKLTKQS
jgi:hypothetical protein